MSIATALRAAGIKVNDRRNVSMGGGSKRAKSRVTHIARHHSGVNVDQSMSILEGYWKGQDWVTGGYGLVIHFDGSADWNYDYDVISNGVLNHNSYTYHISVLGNGKFTAAQERTFQIACKEAQRELGVPTKNVWGHKEFSGHATNACPGINMNTVRAALNNGKPASGSNVSPDTNLKPNGKKITIGTQAKQWQTGEDIPKQIIGLEYDVLQEKSVNQSRSKKAYLIGKGTVATGWLLEQDVKGFSGAVAPTPAPSGKLVEDGIPGYQTYAALQKYFGTPVDGLLSVPSPMVRKLQELVGVTADGIIGPATIRAMQAFFGTPVDGILSSPSSVVIKEIQKRLNAGNLGTKKVTPAANPSVTTETVSIAGVQTFLNKWFDGKLKVDNLMGEATKRAIVRAVQTELNRQFKAGLLVDGWWGAASEAKWATVRRGASGNLTRLIQAILICNGYAVGGFHGRFDDGTHNAVVRYQNNKGLGADGIVGKGTARSMYN